MPRRQSNRKWSSGSYTPPVLDNPTDWDELMAKLNIGSLEDALLELQGISVAGLTIRRFVDCNSHRRFIPEDILWYLRVNLNSDTVRFSRR
ncbi:hypothetical protein DYQ86_16210 [Acidobacteria bacterium AB60]|nr:hypothetical protein DYQ86_16210 [Acidobacteria bacterium AB60]